MNDAIDSRDGESTRRSVGQVLDDLRALNEADERGLIQLEAIRLGVSIPRTRS